ncbi:hypothetical protein [Spiroplasma culicicola]|uniref:Uncharacterized protein n=1 Tax=Spiroplasma culicicola AES-1 TaxID=1276246 RepID=W6AH02_9MOLU|nr:hypothetical protein [Spiroplasma culicicola]AHI52969.1 hypothetical protein SCULI_v1c06280 [Spiroplasma culicicola AES-1]
MIKLFSLIVPTILSSNLAINSFNKVAEDQVLNFSNGWTAEYVYNNQTNPEFNANLWQWDFSSIGVNSIDDLLDNYLKVIPRDNDITEPVVPYAFFTTRYEHKVAFNIQPSWGNLKNIKNVEVRSYDDFKENASWLSTLESNEYGYINIDWGILMSYYISQDNKFIFQLTSGFDGDIEVDYNVKMGLSISPKLVLKAKQK